MIGLLIATGGIAWVGILVGCVFGMTARERLVYAASCMVGALAIWAIIIGVLLAIIGAVT